MGGAHFLVGTQHDWNLDSGSFNLEPRTPKNCAKCLN